MSQRKTRQPDAAAKDEEERQYTNNAHTLEELYENYPGKPRNHSQTLLFSELIHDLFKPLTDVKAQPTAAAARRRGAPKLSPTEQRRSIIERFISRWRAEVGRDIYPAFRLILPDKDARDRGVYGLKESNIGKLLVKVMKIDKNSEDGYKLIKWKVPGQSKKASLAGDFAGRCNEVLSKRPMRIATGDMRLADVNEMLDKLSLASGEAEQLPLFETFYQRMNPDELTWLIRIILKEMKIGATERTFFDIWHPDAAYLFSISSSLRRVCWELFDQGTRTDVGITPMQIFQPQLASYQFSKSFKEMVEKLTGSTDGETEYWIEEKLDGERMQLHMIQDDDIPGGKRFGFWSRKTKNYTYLYGEGLYDNESALTQHLKDAFHHEVRNIILDGEMITWDMQRDKISAFGTLKSAAIAGKKNPFDYIGARALYRVFDVLLINDEELVRFELQARRKALERLVPGVERRLELHKYESVTSPDVIESKLREVVEQSSEGLVLKNPKSAYSLNQRNEDWMKVKPEYTREFGESVEVLVIGAYYGSGRRGGSHSSFLCGLRCVQQDIDEGADPEMCFSFIRVGGGFSTPDYKSIAHMTEGKWMDWDPKRPPTQYIRLAGGDRQLWKPDQWIRPKDSLVIEVKAAQSVPSEDYAKNVTMRFPRFKSIRDDREWNTALDWERFFEMKKEDEKNRKEKVMILQSKRRTVKRVKKEVVIVGQDAVPTAFDGPKTKIFEGLEFCVLTECAKPKKSKAQLEAMIKENGGKVSQRAVPDSEMILIGDKNVIKVASLIKAGDVDIIRPKWIIDCLAQGNVTAGYPFKYEPSHLFHASDAVIVHAEQNVDQYGDSYARNVDMNELKALLADMPKRETKSKRLPADELFEKIQESGHDFGNLTGRMFHVVTAYFAAVETVPTNKVLKYKNWIRFCGGRVVDDLEDESVTTVVVVSNGDEKAGQDVAASVRSAISGRRSIPRIVTQQWLENCWKEKTMLAEERYPA